MNDLIIQFARLWGQKEILVLGFTKEEEKIAEELKSYDSIEMRNLLQQWADEFLYDNEDYEDTVEFFEEKINKMMKEKREIQK